jgi:hypothetical protein
MNGRVLSVLEGLQEFMRSKLALQSAMTDGYMGLADVRRVSTGLLIPEMVISRESPTRRIVGELDGLEKKTLDVSVCGISPSLVDKVRDDFEKSVILAMQLWKIQMQLRDACESVTKAME